jgi:hypothetical protein
MVLSQRSPLNHHVLSYRPLPLLLFDSESSIRLGLADDEAVLIQESSSAGNIHCKQNNALANDIFTL